MDMQWHYCTLEEFAQGDVVQARALFHDDPASGTPVQEYSNAGEALFHLGSAGWEVVSVMRETRQGSARSDPALVFTSYLLKQPAITEAWRHCLMISVDANEDVESSASIVYLDWVDEAGAPHWKELSSKYEGFKMLGAGGWRLVQVIEHPAAEAGYDGPVSANTHYYFRRPARGKE